MNVEELEDRHHDLKWQSYKGEDFLAKEHTKLSIKFAISVLKELRSYVEEIDLDPINDKIQELKQYLDEKG